MNQNAKNAQIAKNVLLYGIGGVLSQAAGLITLPLMVRRLSSLEYGAIEVITALTGYFALLIGFNTLSGLYRYFYEIEADSEEQRRLVSTTFIFVFCCGVAIALLSVFLSPRFSQRLFSSQDMAGNIRLAFLALIPVSIYTYAMGLLRLQNKALPYILISVVVSLFYMGSIILLIGVRRIGIPGYYYSQIIANSAGIVLAIGISRHYFTPAFSWDWFRKLAKYSFPLVPGTLLAWSLSANNRIILNATTSEVQVAYYGLANKAAIVITLATQAFCNAWEPTMYSLLKQVDKIKRTLPQILSLYTFGTLSLCILMMTIAREIFLVLAPPEYLAGIGLLGIIQLRWMFTMGVYVIDPGTAKTGKTWWVTIMLGIAVVVNLIANAILTPLFGLYGAVFSELIGYAAAMIGRWIVSNRLFPVAWHKGYFIGALACYGGVAAVQTWIIMGTLPAGWSFALRLGLAGVFVAVLWLAMDSESKETLVSSIKPAFARLRQKG